MIPSLNTPLAEDNMPVYWDLGYVVPRVNQSTYAGMIGSFWHSLTLKLYIMLSNLFLNGGTEKRRPQEEAYLRHMHVNLAR